MRLGYSLRILDREGLVKAKRRTGRARLYSLHDVRRLLHIKGLMVDQGVNIQGIRVILRMSATLIEPQFESTKRGRRRD